jgi:hypothetical protein
MADTTQPDEPEEDLWNVTPERAGELLAQKAQQYSAAEAAGSAVKEPTRPTDADGKPIAPPVALLTTQERDAQRLADAKDYLEEHGFPPRDSELGADLWDRLEGRAPVDAEMQKQVERKLASFRNDAEWRRKFFAGDARAVAQWNTCCSYIAGGKNQRFQG